MGSSMTRRRTNKMDLKGMRERNTTEIQVGNVRVTNENIRTYPHPLRWFSSVTTQASGQTIVNFVVMVVSIPPRTTNSAI
jgi:hypothetical protein